MDLSILDVLVSHLFFFVTETSRNGSGPFVLFSP
jgi:hypothetical protein